MATGGCVANYTNHRLDLHLPTQFPAYAGFAVAMTLGLHVKDVNIITRVSGGGFGANLSSGLGYSYADTIFTLAAGAASIALDHPVSCFISRDEEFFYYWGRSGMDSRARVGFKNDGTLVFTDTEIWRNLASGGWIGGGTQKYDASCTGMMLYSHNCKAVQHRKHAVLTNGPSFTGWQGFGNPEVFLSMESVMDQAAEKLDIDPVELRRKNHMQGGDNFMDLTYEYNSPHWLGHTGIAPSIDAALKQVPWDERKSPAEKTGVIRHGIGMALHMQQNGGEGLAGSAAVKIFNDGSAVLIENVQDIGQGSRGAQLQIVAETLGIAYEKVRFIGDESITTPSSHPQTCSSGTIIMGSAAHEAALEAKNKLLAIASKVARCTVEMLDTRDGKIFPKGMPEKAFPWIACFAAQNPSTGVTESISGFSRHREAAGPMAAEQGATFVELDVDTETGELKNIKATISQDCGRAINPRVVAAHYLTVHHCMEAITGGAELILDPKTGKILNNSYIDYPVAGILDNEVNPIIVENADASTPFGFVGIGQGFNNGIGAAVSNAIYNAIGVRLKEAPFTPDKILKALGRI
jgi:xanthine dehydrogenase molybdenum-binding subunit